MYMLSHLHTTLYAYSLYAVLNFISHAVMSIKEMFVSRCIYHFRGGWVGIAHSRSYDVFFRSMDVTAQLTSLTVPQLVSLLIALVCELTRRLNTPIEVAATIGEAVDDNAPDAGMSTTSNPAASSAAPTTSSGPLPADQCHFICSIANCDNLCAATCDHGYHRCEQHWWY